MNNRLTASTLVSPNWPLSTICLQYAANGLAGVDFRGVQQTVDHSTLPAFSTNAHETLSLLKEHGLRVPVMCSSVALMTPDEARWKTLLDEYARYLRLADTFGSPYVRIFPGQTPKGMTRDDAATMARRHARQLVKLADGFTARPILETHDDWGAAAEVVKLIADCPPEDFPVLWDIRHTWAAREGPEFAIQTLGERLRHVHLKDSILRDGREVPALLGEGIVNVRQALEALKQAAYDGWLCLETEKRWYPETAPEPEQSLPQFVSFVRSV